MNAKPRNLGAQLYRHFDKDGRLLYVGVAINTIKRLVNHRAQSRWFLKIRTIEIQNFSSLEKARVAERRAITKEHPAFNVRLLRRDPLIYRWDKTQNRYTFFYKGKRL